MRNSYLKLLPYIAIIIAGILFIPYSEYYTCHNTCVGYLCTQMYCPPHPLNIITAVGVNTDVEMPNAGQFIFLLIKSVGAAAVVYAASLVVNTFRPKSRKKKK